MDPVINSNFYINPLIAYDDIKQKLMVAWQFKKKWFFYYEDSYGVGVHKYLYFSKSYPFINGGHFCLAVTHIFLFVNIHAKCIKTCNTQLKNIQLKIV